MKKTTAVIVLQSFEWEYYGGKSATIIYGGKSATIIIYYDSCCKRRCCVQERGCGVNALQYVIVDSCVLYYSILLFKSK